MAKFRKKPVVVEAEQFFPHQHPLPFQDKGAVGFDGTQFYVITIHGQRADLASGDWVIAEPDGEHYYPCKPNIFAAIYEPVSAEPLPVADVSASDR